MAFLSGFEPYVPKTRVVLFEAALFSANGLGFEKTLQGLTLDAAKLLGIQNRVGGLNVRKDADLAYYTVPPSSARGIASASSSMEKLRARRQVDTNCRASKN